MNQIMEAMSAGTPVRRSSAWQDPASDECASLLVEAFDVGSARERADPGFLEAVTRYRSGAWLQAFELLAQLADGGHPPAAKLALLMLRYGPAFHDAALEAQPVRLARWARHVLAARRSSSH